MWEMADDYRNDPKIKTRAKKPAIPGSLLQAILDNGVEIGRAAIMLEVTRSHLYNALARHRNRADHNEVVEDAAVIVQPPADDSAIPLAQAPQRLEAAPPHLNVALVEMVAEMISSNDLVPGTYSAADGALKCDVLEQDHNGLYQPRVLEWRTKQAQVAKILTLARIGVVPPVDLEQPRRLLSAAVFYGPTAITWVATLTQWNNS
jgi:hypothetical protein